MRLTTEKVFKVDNSYFFLREGFRLRAFSFSASFVFSPLAISTIILASWETSRGRFGLLSVTSFSVHQSWQIPCQLSLTLILRL